MNWRRLFLTISESSHPDKRKAFQDAYKLYLKSPQWRHVRSVLYVDREQRCEQCRTTMWEFINQQGSVGLTMLKETKWFDVHHKTYDRIGDELLDDLVLLCKSCHKAQHGKHGKL